MPSPVPRRDCRYCRSVFPQPRPSPNSGWVGSRITRFEACSVFTHITACLLADRPRRPFPSKASTISLPPSPFRLLPAGTTVAGRELHPLKMHNFSRRTKICGRFRGRRGAFSRHGRAKRMPLPWGDPTGVEWEKLIAYAAFCLVKRSRALLASNPARDSQARAGRMSRWPRRIAPSGSLFGHPIANHSFCPEMPEKRLSKPSRTPPGTHEFG